MICCTMICTKCNSASPTDLGAPAAAGGYPVADAQKPVRPAGAGEYIYIYIFPCSRGPHGLLGVRHRVAARCRRRAQICGGGRVAFSTYHGTAYHSVLCHFISVILLYYLHSEMERFHLGGRRHLLIICILTSCISWMKTPH